MVIVACVLLVARRAAADGSVVAEDVQAEVDAIIQKEATMSANGEAAPVDTAAEEKKPKKYKKTTKDWNKLNMDEVDKKWEGSDDPEELEHEFEHIRKVSEKVMRKKQLNIDFDNPGIVHHRYLIYFNHPRTQFNASISI